MNVSDIGEFGLIDRLRRLVEEAGVVPRAGGFRLRIGIGDDAAVWQPGREMEVCTTDTMVVGVHFTPETTPWPDVGWKVMAANLSDVAAMGAVPLYALVTLGLPRATPVADVDRLYGGMLEACRQYEVAIVGGDVVASPVAFVTVAMTGACPGEPLTRSSARPEDAVAVTGTVGESAAGLEIVQKRLPVPEPARSRLLAAHRRPVPRLKEGQLLALRGIRCAMDVSDGLVADLSKLCLASGVAAILEEQGIPVSAELRQAFPDGYLRFALNGGEDYALLFTGPRDTVAAVAKELPGPSGIVGRIVKGQPGHVTVVDAKGRGVEVTAAGWDHFRAP